MKRRAKAIGGDIEKGIRGHRLTSSLPQYMECSRLEGGEIVKGFKSKC